MPSYDYICNNCDKNISLTNIKIDDRDLQNCPTCDQNLERTYVIGNVAVWAPTSGGYR
jgi:putative FmdB family regulatory protein